MSPHEIGFNVYKEHQQDLLRSASRERLGQTARHHQGQGHQKAAQWLVDQISKLKL